MFLPNALEISQESLLEHKSSQLLDHYKKTTMSSLQIAVVGLGRMVRIYFIHKDLCHSANMLLGQASCAYLALSCSASEGRGSLQY